MQPASVQIHNSCTGLQRSHREALINQFLGQKSKKKGEILVHYPVLHIHVH